MPGGGYEIPNALWVEPPGVRRGEVRLGEYVDAVGGYFAPWRRGRV